ncbi:hypothetical protein B5F07_13175 [Lachnoclostridium sp. An169]|uniref:DUF7601 domain-containing protein n=1 Tax=Lachnoclostridium sp. An169 TaxID=1965569 RepID=UPI000B37ACC8|nr:SpaA isopeptide-forming pilin-related protein [Lachnoclostridium sp. An169]OUP82693.1 hypothetical protein B5F07_13175 [Lachnoclostridium sp. An169]
MNKGVGKKQGNVGRRLAGIVITLVMVLGMCTGLTPQGTGEVQAVTTTGTSGHVADDDTRTTYTNYLNDGTSGELTTEFSGRVWADKTVTTDDQTFSGDAGPDIKVTNDSDFLVTYSALATTQSITGEAQSPLDVVFVVDFSGSMINYAMDNVESRLANLLDALNSSIKTLMEANEYNRVAVVCYSGKPDESVSASEVLLPLNHYSSSQNYFSISDRTATTSERTVSWNIDGVSGNHTVQQAHATNTQMGLYTGMNLLTVSDTTVEINGQTVQRVPAVIHLSDGNPTVSSDSQNWWEPANNSGNGNGVVRISSVGNGLKAMMTATYMKQEINRHYNADSNSDYAVHVYNIGMGLNGIFNEVKASSNWNTDIDANKSQNLAYVSLNPGSHWNDSNNIAQNFRDTWNQYKNGTNVIIPVSEPAASAGPGDWTSWWESTFPSENYTVTHPSQNDITEVNDLNYVDQYFSADSADQVTEVFENIVSDITMSTPQVPTNVSPDAIDQSGYITYTDEIGDYMEVKDVKNLIFSGTNFTNPTGSTNGNTTTYAFSGEIDSPVYGKQNANDIVITVTSNTDSSTGKMTQTLTVKIPASAIPLRVNTVELDSSGNVKSHTTNNAYPVRLCYTVGVQDGVKNADGTVDLSKIDDAYKQANTGTDGLYFYSNKYTGDIKCEDQETAGNAYVEFTPAKNNPYFYVQESIPLYTNELCTEPVTEMPTPNDGKTYYYQVQYYSGTQSVTESRSVTGIKGTTELINNQYCVKAGEMNAPHADSKHAEKQTNNTATAELYYYAHMDGENAKIHLGNNGRLAVKTASLAVEKDIEVPEGMDAGQFADQEFSFTVTLKDTDSNLVSGTFSTRHVADDGNGNEVSVESGITSLNFTDGTATFNLKPGEKLYIDGLVKGWSYTVSETDDPDDGFDQTTPADGDASGILGDATTTALFANTYYPGSIAVTKRDGAGDPLKGAAFQLYKDDGTGGKTKVGSPVSTVPRIRQRIANGDSRFDLEHMIFTDTDGKSYPVHTDGSGTQRYFYYRSLTTEEQQKYEQGTLTGYEEVAEFTNLLVNEAYYLKETVVPDGYNAPQTDDDGYLIVGQNEQTKISVPTSDGGTSVYHLLFTVTNHKKMVLPTTGLSGIGWYLAAGVLFLTGSVVLWKLKGAKKRTVRIHARRRRRRK